MKVDLSSIKAEGLHKSFTKGSQEIQVLKGLDLNVAKGEGVAVIGASGTGKSTLLHLMGGLEKPDKGRICYGDRDICRMKDNDLAAIRNKLVGFVFQFHFLLPEFTALENVYMPAIISSFSMDIMKKRAMELMDAVGLADRAAHKPGEMSGGEQQRVALARALMMRPEVLLADEPTGDLDPSTGEQMAELLVKLKNELAVTMIIVTHNHDLARLMDRVMVLRGGMLEKYSL
jgi:lipoprotein-releasing system ATP-binding protein